MGYSFSGITSYMWFGFSMVIPPLLFVLVFQTRSFLHNNIVRVLFLELIVFLTLIVARAPWVGDDPQLYIRYFVYPVFIIGVILLYSELRSWKYIRMCIIGICILFSFKTMYLLSVDTTYNIARAYLLKNAGNTPIFNPVVELDLPKNSMAYEITKESACGSRCKSVLSGSDNGKSFFVVHADTKQEFVDTVNSMRPRYEIATSTRQEVPVFSVSNGLSPGMWFSVDYRLGAYTLDFLRMSRLGDDIFIYYYP